MTTTTWSELLSSSALSSAVKLATSSGAVSRSRVIDDAAGELRIDRLGRGRREPMAKESAKPNTDPTRHG